MASPELICPRNSYRLAKCVYRSGSVQSRVLARDRVDLRALLGRQRVRGQGLWRRRRGVTCRRGLSPVDLDRVARIRGGRPSRATLRGQTWLLSNSTGLLLVLIVFASRRS